MLEWLRATDSHPTAAEVHGALVPEMPELSLGTVYRNLEVLVGQGLIVPVARPGGPARYDGNTAPHHHFVCDGCGSITDVDMKEPRGLRRRLAERYDLHANRVAIDFHGLCPGCSTL